MPKSTQPTAAKDRIIFLDILRGFALSGILFANILSWSGYKFLPSEAINTIGNSETDASIYYFLKFFIDTKFYTIFSILFGIGFYMQVSKNRDNPLFPPLYFRRMCLLLVIGIIHATFWSGDILTLYALTGMILLSMRNVDPKKLLHYGALFYFTPVLLDIVYMLSFASELPNVTKTAIKQYPDMTPDAVVNAFQSTNFLDAIRVNLHNLLWRWYDFIPSGRPLKILGLFFLGSHLYNIQFFKTGALKWKNALLFGILGIGLTYASTFFKGSAAEFSKNWYQVSARLLHETAQINLSMFYICFLAILVDMWPAFFVFNGLKKYGRMSLTSYIGQTVLGILIFYPFAHTFQAFGLLSLESIYYIGCGMLAFQLLYSNLWFRYFKFGPVEWLWRCATLKKWLPIRINA
ncbi:DUF418 domain-containing protein [Flavicella sp.]|uniref:DUF418 domain-containing protein n=1 Tax=Flavicella sp. TaxID=2957742 RepID=UPI00262751A7|nr:DUF418 domain-containing protein [Flavicella sp.]MDG1806236.1 DUF418 domain-containing protein [Flavicella sp.]